MLRHNYVAYPQARVQEFVRGGAKSERLFFLLFNFLGGGGPAQKIPEKMTFSTKKVAKYSLKFALMTFFFGFSISRGGAGPLDPPPLDTRHAYPDVLTLIDCHVYCHDVLQLMCDRNVDLLYWHDGNSELIIIIIIIFI